VSTADECALRNLIARFAQATDVGTLDDYANCLSEDATMAIDGLAPRIGRAEIVAAMASNREQALFGPGSGSVHIVGASVIEVDGDIARASTSFLFVGSAGRDLGSAGRYADTFERTADGWRLMQRRVALG
jgi:ketosteroid isomerase-like protein